MEKKPRVYDNKGIFKPKYEDFVIGYGELTRKNEFNPIVDGDTISMHLDGSVHARFLNVDTPEKGLDLPNFIDGSISKEERETENVGSLNSKYWREYLIDPFRQDYPRSDELKEEIGPGLFAHLQKKIGSSTAVNQFELAMRAGNQLSELIMQDKEKLEKHFQFFKLYFECSYELFDRYGRLLCYISPKDKLLQEEQGDLTYNDIMLSTGFATPYFIFPNTLGFVNRLVSTNSLRDSIPDVRKDKKAFHTFMSTDTHLKKTRDLITDARKLPDSVWKGENQLKLLPFELRYLQRRMAPDRWVIDLSEKAANDADEKGPVIYKPTNYYNIEKEEDRFFIPYDCLPLFEEKGYSIEGPI